MPENSAAAVTDEIRAVRESGTRFPVAVAVLRLRVAGHELGDDGIAAIARCLEANPAEVRRVVAFFTALLADEPADGAVCHRCVSISCSQNGADELWRELGPLLDRAGLARPIVPVHCLGQCEDGPSLGHADRIYTGRQERVVRDDRPWRESPLGRSD